MRRYSGFGNEGKTKFKRGISRKARKRHGRYKDSGSTIFKRVIRDGYDGLEFIVDGYENTTFGEACKDQWQFESVRKNSDWFIKDERGNDITNEFLISYSGISILLAEYKSEKKERASDRSDEYSIHDSVTYYD